MRKMEFHEFSGYSAQHAREMGHAYLQNAANLEALLEIRIENHERNIRRIEEEIHEEEMKMKPHIRVSQENAATAFEYAVQKDAEA